MSSSAGLEVQTLRMDLDKNRHVESEGKLVQLIVVTEVAKLFKIYGGKVVAQSHLLLCPDP